ncbi:MerR family transcriptional regulator [Mucilaginibacter calamicampi]|uniref:MerR family transcriptional regulator n=1 Tax=Mucilaginibacter calamicampi TaxID=1302352 RepID=A0ABW2YVH2_9SPHI
MFGEVFLKDNVENIFKVFGICDKIFNPVLTVNDLGISYRTINSWETSGLMLRERSNSRNWHKFSFVDFVWLNIVYELRQLGFPLSKIKMLKDFLNENIDEKALFEVKRREALISLNSVTLDRLVMLLAEILHNKNHIALLCNKEGGVYIYNEQLIKEDRSAVDLGQLAFNNFVSISFTDIIIKYLNNTRIDVIEETGIVDYRFLEILIALREGTIQGLIFQLPEEKNIQIEPALFNKYHDFRNACLRLMLTVRFDSIVVI